MDTQTIEYHQHSVMIRQISNVGFYRFAVDVHYGFGLHLPFLFSEEEVHHTISVAKVGTPQYVNSLSGTLIMCLDSPLRG